RVGRAYERALQLLGMLVRVLVFLLSLAICATLVAYQTLFRSQYATVTTAVVLNVVLGGALLASAAITRKNLMNGAIVAGVISIILVYHTSRPGPSGGIVWRLVALLAAAEPYLPCSRPASPG